jgi:hypothetical protein
MAASSGQEAVCSFAAAALSRGPATVTVAARIATVKARNRGRGLVGGIGEA